MWDVTAEAFEDADGEFVAVKGQGPSVEVNLRFRRGEAQALEALVQSGRLHRVLRSHRWVDRGSIQAGTLLGAPVFWSRDEETICLLAGEDDETWDVGLDELPLSFVVDLLREVAEAERG